MTLTIGFLGGGNIARSHLRGVRRAVASGLDVGLGPVYDPDGERAGRRVAEFGGWPAASVDEVINGSDAVYVCTWTSTHEALADRVLEAGRALFCEKPLALDLAGARRIADHAARAGVIAQVGLVLRRSPAFEVLGRLVGDPEAGDVMAVMFRDDQYLPVGGRYGSDWRIDVERAGRGVLMEHSIHDVDLLEHHIGPIRAVATRTAAHHGHPGIEDVAVVNLRFAGGALGTLVTTWHDVESRPSQRFVEVHCRRRVIRLEGEWTGRVEWEDASGTHVLADEALLAEAARHRPDPDPDVAFLRSVLDGTPAWPSLGDAVRSHVVLEAAYLAADGDEWVAVPLPGEGPSETS